MMDQGGISAVGAKRDIEGFRIKLSQEMPHILDKVTREYIEFSSTQDTSDVKSFTAYQTACRAALTHLQLLIKIASWVQPNLARGVSIDDDSELDQLIVDARTEIRERFHFKD